MTRARRIALYAGGGTGGLAVVGTVSTLALMWAETKLAKRRIPRTVEPPPATDGTVWAAAGVSPSRPPITLALLGDSTAAGLGALRERDTPAAQLAIAISDAARRPVRVAMVAVVGAESPDLPPQITALGTRRPELAVIMVGANDVTELTKPSVAVPFLEDAVRALCALGAEVVVGTCPDLGTVRPISQPLRAYARHLSRQMAKAQTVAVVRAGGRTVSLGDLLGPIFMSSLDYFAADRFHPSAAGYAEATRALLPSCLDALGLRTKARSASTFTTRRVKPVAKAAAQAVTRPGTEVAGAERFGKAENRRGPLAQLRRRRPRRDAPPSSPEQAVPVHPESAS